MRVVYKEPNEEAKILDIDNELDALQYLISGWIECIPFVEGVCVIVNEEGKLLNMQPNFIYGREVVVGPAVFVGEADEDFTDITESGIEKVMKFLRYYAV